MTRTKYSQGIKAMTKSQLILQKALDEMVGKIDATLKSYGYSGEPIKMTLAGGMAVSYYCGIRYTEDVDATFSRKILLPFDELVVNYTKEDGTDAIIYFDTNYTPSLALMHDDYEECVVEYANINTPDRNIKLFVLSPLDLAISKISRFSDQDVNDILSLARQHYFTIDEFKNRAMDALSYYIGNIESVKNSITIVCEKIVLDQTQCIRTTIA